MVTNPGRFSLSLPSPYKVQAPNDGRMKRDVPVCKASTARPWDGAQPLRSDAGAWPTIAPSALPVRDGWHVPKAMDEADIERVKADFQSAAVKLLKVRQSAAAFISRSPVTVKWTGPNGEKYKWIDGLVKHDTKSASVGLAVTKIHHFMESTENASRGDRARHRFYETGNKVWSVGKTAWSVV